MAYYGCEVTMRSIAIVGPTASGKTELAVRVMERWPIFEAVSVDSMTVYREFTVGTAKPTPEELRGKPYHLVSIVSVEDEFSLGSFLRAVDAVRSDLRCRTRLALFVGGTSLYLRAIIDGVMPPPRYLGLRYWLEILGTYVEPKMLYDLLRSVDPQAAAKIESNNLRRTIRALEVSFGSAGLQSVYGGAFLETRLSDVLQFGIDLPREVLYQRIEDRIKMQLESGWVDEVEKILQSGAELSRTAAQAIGYKELMSFLKGEMSYDEAVYMTVSRTKNLAKRQLAWLRRDKRIYWGADVNEVFELIAKRF